MLGLRLAWQELRHDWIAATCFVAALVGILTPLLILLALKNGVLGGLVDRLVDDPNNREIIIVGSGRFDTGDFDALRADPRVGFVVPATRSINTLADALQNRDARRLERAVPLVPTAMGDPLLGAVIPAAGEVVLSASLALKLDAAEGSALTLFAGREIDGSEERASRSVTVRAVLDADRHGRDAAFLPLGDLLMIERFRDDAAISTADWTLPRPAPETYSSLRLYAARLEDLGALRHDLEARGLTARLRAENAALLLTFRNNLNLVYAGITGLAVAGFWAAMAANLRGMVERRRVAYSLLRLLGLGRGTRLMIPVIQGQVLVLGGILVTLCLVLPALRLLNAAFDAPGVARVAALFPSDVLATLLLGIATALTATLWAVLAIQRISSREVLQHG